MSSTIISFNRFILQLLNENWPQAYSVVSNQFYSIKLNKPVKIRKKI
jgi:hypothetical protein